MRKDLTTDEKIVRLIDEQTDLCFDRAFGEAQRNQKLWEEIQLRVEHKGKQIKALRDGLPMPQDLPPINDAVFLKVVPAKLLDMETHSTVKLGEKLDPIIVAKETITGIEVTIMPKKPKAAFVKGFSL